jgi:hypothetical protein
VGGLWVTYSPVWGLSYSLPTNVQCSRHGRTLPFSLPQENMQCIQLLCWSHIATRTAVARKYRCSNSIRCWPHKGTDCINIKWAITTVIDSDVAELTNMSVQMCCKFMCDGSQFHTVKKLVNSCSLSNHYRVA